MRGAHDDGSHGSKCLGGLKPTGGAIAGMAQRARGLTAADSRKPSRGVKRHASWFAMINVPATTMSVEKTRKRVLLRSLPSFLGSDRDGYQDQSDGQRHQGQRKQWFFHGISSRTLWFRCFDVRFFCAC